MAHTQKYIKIIFIAVLLIKLFVLIIKSVALYKGKNAAYKFVEAILEEYDYCKKVIKEHFHKNLIISAEEEERCQLTNSCWICDKLFDVGDNKVRDHCHITGKYRGTAHWSCNVNLKLSKKNSCNIS